MDSLIGIDLGTTNCTVTAIDENGKTTVLKNHDGEFITPSAVYFAEDNKVVVGKRAKSKLAIDPQNTVVFVKREIGNPKEKVRYDPIEMTCELYKFRDNEKIYSPEEISALILKQLKEDAEKALGKEIKKAVITCPAYFGERERDATKTAGVIAGLEVLQILPEPEAAALSYSATSPKSNETIFVFDLGGGTFDVTIIEIKNSSSGKVIETKATDGHRKLGGKDWDDLLMSYMLKEYTSETGVDLRYEKGVEMELAKGKLRLECEKAKKTLTDNNQTTVEFSYGGQAVKKVLSRADYAKITSSKTDSCRTYCENVLREAGKTWDDIDTVLMVGSMSNVIAIRDALKSWCGKSINFRGAVDPKTCVSEGAAIKAFVLEGGSTVQKRKDSPDYDKMDDAKATDETAENSDSTTESEDVEVVSGFFFSADEDEAERVSATIASAKSVIPSTLGVKGKDAKGNDMVQPIITKNTVYPCIKKITAPLNNSSHSLSIDVMEGESREPSMCDKLGTVTLQFNEKLPKGSMIDVSMRVDENGILQVSAENKKTGAHVEVVIEREGAMSKEDVAEAVELIGGFSFG